jgi:hypothetical protein
MRPNGWIEANAQSVIAEKERPMIKRRLTITMFMAAAFVLAAGLIGSAGAQDTATPAAGIPSHPAHIHTGTCATLGEVVFPLNNVSVVYDITASPVASPVQATPAPASSVLSSTTIVETTLDDLLGAEHAINVHQSEAEIQTSIACGAVSGTPSDGMLVVALDELNDSGASGQATLIDNGDGTITVDIALTHSAMATPVASPAA